VKWHGGKYYQAPPRIVPLFGPHETYVEPYAGGLNAMLNKTRAAVEVAGDLDALLIEMYETLTTRTDALLERLAGVAWGREAFAAAPGWRASGDPLTRATGVIVGSRFSRGGTGRSLATQDRTRGDQPGEVNSWQTIREEMPAIAGRLRGVRFVCGPALDLIRAYDGPDTLFYCDPPYDPTARTARTVYRYEMTVGDHREMLGVLLACRGMVILSGYRTPLYDELVGAWERIDYEMPNHAGQGKQKQRRIESLWLNPAASAAAPWWV
jgi:DNA adenine methylase